MWTNWTEKSPSSFGNPSPRSADKKKQTLLASLRELEAEKPERALDRFRILELANKAHSVIFERAKTKDWWGTTEYFEPISQTPCLRKQTARP
jgi:hypothetical protein